MVFKRFARRAWHGLRRRAARFRAARSALMLLRDVPPVAVRNPRLGFAIARADIADPADPAMAPLIERALDRHRSNWLLSRKADLLSRAGEFSAARDTWRELAEGGVARAANKVRLPERDPA